jgi:hypothetical protein
VNKPSITALFLLALPAASAQAQTCPCGPKLDVVAATHAATAVFEGRVTGVSFTPSESRSAVASLDVVRVWKGMAGEKTTVASPPQDVAPELQAPCALAFEPGQSYLVFARARADGQLETSVCSRTRPVEEAQDDVLALGMGSAPVTPQAPAVAAAITKEPPARGGCASCSVGATRAENATSAPWLSLGALAVMIGVRGARRRRAQPLKI